MWVKPRRNVLNGVRRDPRKDPSHPRGKRWVLISGAVECRYAVQAKAVCNKSSSLPAVISLLHQRLIDLDGLLGDVLPAKDILSALLTRLANLGSAVAVGDHVVDSGSDSTLEALRIGLVVVN